MKRKITQFLYDVLRLGTTGSKSYHIWMALLTVMMIIGGYAYSVQFDEGLIVTGMNDHVSWGLYISNFTFLVGLAAAAVMLVLPAYVLQDKDFSKLVLIGEALAVSALIMCLCFVTADMGGPAKLWHMMPGIGIFNFPQSMLAWDVVVLNGYLAINATVPAYLLYCKHQGVKPNRKIYVPIMYLSVMWAFGIHLVTAFLYAGLPSKPFWNNALLGPRFLASAFAAGPAFIVLALGIMGRLSTFKISDKSIQRLTLVITVAAQVNLIMLVSELFKEFYRPTHHSISAQYLFFGLDGHDSLVPWIWGGILMNVVATIMLTIHPARRNFIPRTIACVLLFVGVWIEKGMGLIVPGFIPSPLGEIVEYSASPIEILVTVGIWSLGLFIFTFLARVAIALGEKEEKDDARKAAAS